MSVVDFVILAGDFTAPDDPAWEDEDLSMEDLTGLTDWCRVTWPHRTEPISHRWKFPLKMVRKKKTRRGVRARFRNAGKWTTRPLYDLAKIPGLPKITRLYETSPLVLCSAELTQKTATTTIQHCGDPQYHSCRFSGKTGSREVQLWDGSIEGCWMQKVRTTIQALGPHPI